VPEFCSLICEAVSALGASACSFLLHDLHEGKKKLSVAPNTISPAITTALFFITGQIYVLIPNLL
jgi:hypothetical protein